MKQKRLFFFFLFVICVCNGFAVNAGSTDFDLRRIVVEGCEAICSSSFENEDIQKIEKLSQRFNLQSAQKLAISKRHRLCDRGDSLAIEALDELTDCMQEQNTESYCLAYVYFTKGILCPTKLLCKEYFFLSSDYVDKVQSDLEGPDSEELKIASELMRIVFSTDLNGPTEYEKFRRLWCRMQSFYEKTAIHSFVRQSVYDRCAVYSNYMKTYGAYAAHIEHKLRNENLDGYGKLDNVSLMEEIKKGIAARVPEHHPDNLILQAKIVTDQVSITHDAREAENFLIRLDSLRNEAISYFGHDHYIPTYIAFEYNCVKCQQNRNDKIIYGEALECLEKLLELLGDNTEEKMSCLARMLGISINRNSSDAAMLFERLDELSSEKLFFEDDVYFEAQCNRLYLQHAHIQGYENSYDYIKNLKKELFDEELDWRSINAMVTLIGGVQSLHGFTEDVVELYDEFFEALNSVSGEESDLAVLCAIAGLNFKISSGAVTKDREAIFDFIDGCISRSQKINVNLAPFYLAKAVCLASEGSDTVSAVYFRKALEANEDYCAGNVEEVLLLKVNIYESWLNTLLSGGGSDDLIKECVAFLSPIADNEMEMIKLEHMNLYAVMCNYYTSRNDYASALRIAEACVEFYHENIKCVDSNYVMFTQMVAYIYATTFADMEKSRSFIEQIRADADQFKAFLGFNDYIMILRICYDFVESKSPNDFGILYQYYVPLAQSLVEYVQSAGSLDEIVWNHMPYFILKTSNFYKNMSVMRKMNPGVANELQWEQQKAQCREWLKMVDIDGRLDQMPALKKTPNYQVWLGAMAQLNEYLFEDYDEAEKCYEALAENNEILGLGWYSAFLMRHNRWDSIKDKVDVLLSNFYQRLNVLKEKGTVSVLSDDTSFFFQIFYRIGDYKRAYDFATMYSEMRTEYIARNFDYFTSQEREHYIQQGGAGSFGFYCLLPHLGTKVSADAYNAALREKGLLLRAYDRVRLAIENSGNQKLISAIDSLKLLAQSYLSITDFNDQDNINNAVSIRQKMDVLERYVNSETAQYKTADEVPSWEDIRDSLKKDEVAIEFVAGDSAMSALVLRKNFKLPKIVQVLNTKDAEHILSYMNDPVLYTENMKTLYEKDGQWLYETIWKPLLPIIGNAKRVYYSPSGLMNALSFAAFKKEDGSYLIDNYDLRLLSTTAKLVNRASENILSSETKSLVIGGLCYEDVQAEFMDEDVAVARQSSESVIRQREAMESFQFLPFSYIEQEQITATLNSNGVETDVYAAMNAKENIIREKLQHAPDILHISTHGFNFTDYQQAMNIPFIHNRGQITPLNCAGIALSDANPTWEGDMLPNECDNILTADELSSIDLRNTKLVVLSACNTALGAVSQDGVMGLQRGLKQAGASSLCLSLWSVNDASSATMMTSFYNNWLEAKMSMGDAMRSAIIKQKEMTTSPYYWAPFILIDAIE